LIAHFGWALRRMSRWVREVGPVTGTEDTPATALTPRLDPRTAWVAVMFFVSGAAALAYEVIFSKSLALAFGSTALAMYTVLMTYMAGMAIGAWAGGRIAERSRSPLVVYAVCELAIALWCAISPWTRPLFRSFYVSLAAGVPPDAESLTWLRLLIGGALLFPVTFLMGITLPVMAKALSSRLSLGRATATLYTANTAGAAFGALATAYWVIPSLGVNRTTFAAALFSCLAALLALRLREKSVPDSAATSAPASAGAAPVAPPIAPIDAADRSFAKSAFTLVTLCGFITLALEVVYIHLLAVVAGNSVYAFGLMLFAFLTGLSLGGGVARRVLARAVEPAQAFAIAGFVLAATILGGVLWWDSLPSYFAQFAGHP
jgi:predicted membrane-bound spermidine synthase